MAHEFDGQKYAQASTHQKEWGRVLLDELQLQGCESALDLGCGDGALTARIAELLPQGSVVGIDASRGMIDAAFGQRWRMKAAKTSNSDEGLQASTRARLPSSHA
jgi:trans-aconitate methyltransferase